LRPIADDSGGRAPSYLRSAIQGGPVENAEAHARNIVDANRYMTLATADEAGLPWASPVWYAHSGYREFFWVSRPEARHSRNLSARPELAIVIFDSHAPGAGRAVYLEARAEQLEDDELARGIEVFSSRSEAQGLPRWGPEDVREPARHRLYRATAGDQFLLDAGDRRIAVQPGTQR
jgi:nitroimidazol reductase NimA-like FMN-containing flavoprotein (pyridoxamine 5'-phosphate oxidase superfamily)